MPKILALSTEFRILSAIESGIGTGGFLEKLTDMTKHFVGFRDMLFWRDQSWKSFRACCIFDSWFPVLLSTSVKSSTYLKYGISESLHASFIISRKRMGPSLVPCGTPQCTNDWSDALPKYLTHCCRFSRPDLGYGWSFNDYNYRGWGCERTQRRTMSPDRPSKGVFWSTFQSSLRILFTEGDSCKCCTGGLQLPIDRTPREIYGTYVM